MVDRRKVSSALRVGQAWGGLSAGTDRKRDEDTGGSRVPRGSRESTAPADANVGGSKEKSRRPERRTEKTKKFTKKKRVFFGGGSSIKHGAADDHESMAYDIAGSLAEIRLKQL